MIVTTVAKRGQPLFLADAGKSQPIEAPDIDWAEFYARLFIERYL